MRSTLYNGTGNITDVVGCTGNMHGTRDEIELRCGTAGDIYDRIGRFCGTGDDVHHCADTGGKCNTAIQSHTGNITDIAGGNTLTGISHAARREAASTQSRTQMSDRIKFIHAAECASTGRDRTVIQDAFQIGERIEAVEITEVRFPDLQSRPRGIQQCTENCHIVSSQSRLRTDQIRQTGIGRRRTCTVIIGHTIDAGNIFNDFVIAGIVEGSHAAVHNCVTACGSIRYTPATGCRCRFNTGTIGIPMEGIQIVISNGCAAAGSRIARDHIHRTGSGCRRDLIIERFGVEGGSHRSAVIGKIRIKGGCSADHIDRSGGKGHIQCGTAGDVHHRTRCDQLGIDDLTAVGDIDHAAGGNGDVTDSTGDQSIDIGEITADFECCPFVIYKSLTEHAAGNTQRCAVFSRHVGSETAGKVQMATGCDRCQSDTAAFHINDTAAGNRNVIEIGSIQQKVTSALGDRDSRSVFTAGPLPVLPVVDIEADFAVAVDVIAFQCGIAVHHEVIKTARTDHNTGGIHAVHHGHAVA